MSGKIVYRLSGVSFSYPGATAPAVAGVSADVFAGEMIALIGPNGAGKSTLLGLLGGLVQPAAGQVEFFGRPMARWPSRERARAIAMIRPDLDSVFPLTVFDVVALGRVPYLGRWGRLTRADVRAVWEALQVAGLAGMEFRLIATLSQGERQRAILARALAQKPKVLLLDEPIAHLDLAYQLDTLRRLQALAQEGIAIVSALHDINLAAQFFDRVWILSEGKLVADGPPAGVIDGPTVSRVFHIDVRVWFDPVSRRPQVSIPVR